MISAKKDYLKRVLSRRSFAGLMDLYEQNYRLLNDLIPDLEQLPDRVVSGVPQGKDLYLTIQEKCRFTTTVSLTYYFDSDSCGSRAEPDLLVRIYHDAGQAEAMACRRDGFMPFQDNDAGHKAYLDCRWESNLFVEKWLRYLLGQGYRFSLDRVEPAEEDPENELMEVTE